MQSTPEVRKAQTTGCREQTLSGTEEAPTEPQGAKRFHRCSEELARIHLDKANGQREPNKAVRDRRTMATPAPRAFKLSSAIFLTAALLAIPVIFAASPALAKDKCPGCHKNRPQGNSTYDPVQQLVPGGAAPLTGGTQSTTLQTGTQNTTLQVGTESTTLQVGTESTTLQVGTSGTLIQAGVEREGGPVNLLFLVDASHSMIEKIPSGDGYKEEKMDGAKRVLQQTIANLPPDIHVGLRVFGQGFSNDPYSDCQQSALLVPIGRNNRRAVIEKVRELRAHGLTPLTYALTQAENDLRYCNGPKTIILISDGAETCGGDPCAYIDRLAQLGVKIKVDIVGLGLKRDKDAKEQLGCIARVSGGKYYDANTAAELVNSISNSVKQALSGKVLTKMKTGTDILPADLQSPPGTTTTPPANNPSP